MVTRAPVSVVHYESIGYVWMRLHLQIRVAAVTTEPQTRKETSNKKETRMKCRTLIFSALGVLVAASTVKADLVTDWNSIALQAIRVDKTPPPKASRALAILHASIFDSVNGIRRTYTPYRVIGQVNGSASEQAAAAAAAHAVLVSLFPAQRTSFDAAYTAQLNALRDSPQLRNGVTWGNFVASSILASRASDGSTNVVAIPTLSGPGYWVPTPPALAAYLLPQWGQVAPFAITSSSQFRPTGPPALTSAKWADAYNEVKALGAATNSTRTADQTEIALFWADGAGTETPPGHWNHIAQGIAAARGNTLEQNARLFALLNLAMADAGICAWDAKYTFFNWRPVTAIRAGDTDGNEATAPDAAWSSFIVTPPFPDYCSGHSTFSAAAATVLAMFYGTDNIAFTTGSDFMPGTRRSFTSFSAAAQEAADSRVYGGIHYRFASEDGLAGGLSIGQWTFTHSLQPKSNRSQFK